MAWGNLCCGCEEPIRFTDRYVLGQFPGKQFHRRCKMAFLDGFNVAQMKALDVACGNTVAEMAYEDAKKEAARSSEEKEKE